MNKTMTSLVISVAGLILTASPVFAHSVVTPKQVGIGAFQDFSLGVPSEKDVATIAVKLIIPDSINSVTPIVKSGWKVEIINSTKQGQPDDDGNTNPIPEAIVWTGGVVPAHQKDFFMFSTQVPAKETELDWKIEQTYADGTVVSWSKSAQDQPKDEKGDPDFSKFGPYSITMVINDLKPTETITPNTTAPPAQSNLTLMFSIVALALSVVCFVNRQKK